jgi:hypothetical protein
MDGRPANQARQCLIRRSSNRTCAGRGVGWQVQDGLVQTFLSCAVTPYQELCYVTELATNPKNRGLNHAQIISAGPGHNHAAAGRLL